MSNELSLIPAELVRQSTDIASLCKQIVVASAVAIQGRKYVRVEGWQSIATAHGCVASARDVKRVEGGMSAIGEIRRMKDGQVIATAEGFVGEDEATWYGGEIDAWDKGKRIKKTLPKRLEYAIRAMAQTRAISRACRSCFAHVVVLMDAGLETTPAEEVPERGDYDNGEPDSHDSRPSREPARAPRATSAREIYDAAPPESRKESEEKAFADDQLPGLTTWRDVVVHVKCTLKDKKLGDLQLAQLKVVKARWIETVDWTSENPIYYTAQDKRLKAAVLMGIEELEKPLAKDEQWAGLPAKEADTNGRVAMLAKVRVLLIGSNLTEPDFIANLRRNKQCPDAATKLNDIPDDWLEQYISEWPKLMESHGAATETKKKGAKK